MQWAATRPARNGGRFLTVNAGRNEANYQVRELAERVAAAVPGTKVDINTAAPADSRSYRVHFPRIAEHAPAHTPPTSLADSLDRLVQGLSPPGLIDPTLNQP